MNAHIASCCKWLMQHVWVLAQVPGVVHMAQDALPLIMDVGKAQAPDTAKLHG
jgi:hypothetical protein